MTISDITKIAYEESDCVFYRNIHQSAFMIWKGATLVDIFSDSNCVLVFVFSKEDHKRYLQEWIDRKNQNTQEEINE